MTTINIQQKIEQQTSSIQKKIDALSGDHLTNTPKRMREQQDRNKQIEKYQYMKQILEYLGEEETCRYLNTFERELLNRTFHEEMYSCLAQKIHSEEHSYQYSLSFPVKDEKMVTRFHKAEIHDTDDLLRALEVYQHLFSCATIPRNTKADRILDLTYKARLLQGGDIQFTPLTLVTELIKVSQINSESRVLDPEAGIANIADEVKKVTPHVDCVEIVHDFRELLELKGHHLIGGDFLACEPIPSYDAVIMNPPFSKECQHIRHAFDFLKPGGTLVSICCNRILYPRGKIYIGFYEWLEQQNYRFKQVTSKFQNCSVHTVILIIYNFS